MKIMRPVPATILCGMICAMLFIPMIMVFRHFMLWPYTFHLTIWLYLVLYSLTLTRLGNRTSINSLIFPLLIPVIFIFWAKTSTTVFLVLCLAILSWIRSGICFQSSQRIRSVAAEFLVAFGGGAVVGFFSPRTLIAWTIGIWLFFLIQSLYFVFFVKTDTLEEETFVDPFEKARKRVEEILNSPPKG